MDQDHSARRREFLQRALQSGVWTMAAASGLLAPLSAVAKRPKKLPPGKSIYDMRGSVSVDSSAATMETLITANSTVETGSNSFISFVVGADSHMLRENSKIELGGEGMVEEFMRLVSGKVLSVFGRRNEGESHTIHTTTATIGIRGTGIYTESEPDVSYVCTCYGLVNLASNTDPTSSELIKSEHHDAPRYIYADGYAGKLIAEAPFKDHTDQELMLLEALVGRTTPFSSIRGYSSPRRGY
ncbi:MAG: FecR domain-containing protein [Gammaproteobacteria bacterium]|nr:FecR domain-containing protein [Gammaproteobacteria bacterium]NNF67892.1 hypothetical protein [Gammaproteobacteria bacterium]